MRVCVCIYHSSVYACMCMYVYVYVYVYITPRLRHDALEKKLPDLDDYVRIRLLPSF